MSRVLIIESSARQQDSFSRQLTRQFMSQWQAAHPADLITVRDVARNPVPHLDANLLGGWMKPEEQRSEAEQASLQRSNELTDEVLAADVLVLAAPMYNFAIPSTLKAWLDQVLVPGKMFNFGPEGLVPTHHLRTVVLLVSSDQVYKEGDLRDGLTPALRAIFAYIGVEDIQIAWADGQDAVRHFDSNERREMAIEAAKEIAEDIAAQA